MKLPQLTLRDLFWLVLVAGLLAAWWVERGKLVAEVEALKAQNNDLQLQLRGWIPEYPKPNAQRGNARP